MQWERDRRGRGAMRKPVLWTGAVAGAVVGACSRLMGLAFGKAIAFTYAVIVSVVANVLFDFVRDPPHTAPAEPVAAVAVENTGGVAARAVLPTSPPATPATVAAPVTTLPAPPPPNSARPGPGSGGLY